MHPNLMNFDTAEGTRPVRVRRNFWNFFALFSVARRA